MLTKCENDWVLVEACHIFKDGFRENPADRGCSDENSGLDFLHNISKIFHGVVGVSKRSLVATDATLRTVLNNQTPEIK